MKFLIPTLFLVLFCSNLAQAQMWNGVDSLYGNEWIDFDQSYYKIMVAEDGIYQVSGQELSNAGVPINDLEGKQLQLFHMGNEIPIHTSSENAFGGSDYIEFFGEKNRSELDRYLFNNPDMEMLNPKYSMFTDTSAYFLTWTDAPTLRYTSLENDLTNLPAKETSFMYEQETVYSSDEVKKVLGGDKNSNFDVAEGYGQAMTNEQEISLTPQLIASGTTAVDVNLRLGTDGNSHNITIDFDGINYATLTASNYQVHDLNYNIPVSGNNPSINLHLKGNASEIDRHSISNITVAYPRQFNFNNQSKFAFTIGAGSRKYIEITNFASGSEAPILYDLTMQRRLVAVRENGIVKFALPASTVPLDLILVNTPNGVSSVANINSIDFIDYSDMNTEFLIISNQVFFDDGQGDNAVQEYADYRSSAEGGSYNTTIVEIQQIYDQFGYGVNRHNLCVRNFANYAKKSWDDWKFAMLIGKSREYSKARTGEELNETRNETFYLPTYGSLGSAMLMFAPMGKITPVVGVGQLPAINTNEIRIYLDKIQTYEDAYKNKPQTIEDRAWMSRVMHLGGGLTPWEQDRIKNDLENMGSILVENKFGANITSFYKTTSDAIQTSQSEELTNLINNGVSMITFFGHSSANGFDFSLDDPRNYENIGKYPVISSYGCYAGQIHTENRSIGEQFMFAPERGAIGFYASVGQGYIQDLDPFGDHYYSRLGSDLYGRSVGEIHNAVNRHFEAIVSSNLSFRYLLMQTIYQGDPAMKLNPQPGPDYLVDTKSVSINPSPVNIEVTDSIKVDFSIVNIGQNTADSIAIKIVQELPNNVRVTLFDKKVKTSAYSNAYSFNFATQGKESIGQNRLYITADANNDVAELPSPAAENNNEFANNLGVEGLPFFVFSNDARPLYPTEFGITADQNVTLKATTTNTFIGQQKYLLQIDTTERFDSPFKASTAIEQEGGLIEWQPNIPFEDNTVYYWRISPDSIADVGFLWQNSSFLFKENTNSGWNQSHYFQYLDDDFEQMKVNDQRKFFFGDDVFSYELRTSTFDPATFPQVIVNNVAAQLVTVGALANGLYIGVIDPNTGLLWSSEGTDYGTDDGQAGQALAIRYGFPFKTDTPENREEIINFLTNVVPSGAYVALMTQQVNTTNNHYNPELWAADSVSLGTNIFQVLEQQGARMSRQLIDHPVPYSFVFRKDNTEYEIEENTGDAETIMITKFDIVGSTNNGKVRSSFIGPATQWTKLLWQSSELEPEFDTEQLNLYGVRANGEKDLIKEDIVELDYSLTDIDAGTYPYLQLEYATTDETFHTTPQLDFWRVLYEGVPEATLNKNAHYEFQSDTLQQGEILRFELAVDNISDYDMDSLLVKYTITDANNTEQSVNKRIEPLVHGERLITDFSYNTKDLVGKQVLSIEINPDDDQLEQYHVNNLGFVEFYVEKDKRNPVLDITFDGIHIMDGDFVSPDPLIVIDMEDENQYLALSDTALFEVSLVYPDNSTQEISLNDPAIQFFPSTNSNGKNQARLEFSPIFTQEGNYRLLVNGKDASGNSSGQFDYDIAFEVILEDMISQVLNYPNPFSTSTQFVYTLTGHAPEFFKLQIMTVGGRVVKEIDQSEMGDLKVGTHRTDYTWDGTDEYGDRLANGIYLYRIIAEDANGQQYDTYNTAADSYFKNNFGKMVILR